MSQKPMPVSVRRSAEFLFLGAILVLAAALRLPRITETPGWYPDEATHIDIAHHLAQGQVQYMAVTQSTLLFGRLPLFHVILATLYRALPFADPLLVLRTFTALLGAFTTGMLYAGVRRSGGAVLALLAALAAAFYPQAVIYQRFGFSYNLLAPLLLIMMLCLDRFLETLRGSWLIGASLALGLCLVAEVQAITLILPFMIILFKRWRWFPLVFGVAALPVLVYSLWMVLTAPDAFMFDLRFTLGRLGASLPLDVQWTTLTNNFNEMMARDPWVILGVLGLFALPVRWRWTAILMVILPLVSMGRVVALYQLSAYYLIPFLPLFALGVAALVWAGTRALYEAAHEHLPEMEVSTVGAVVLTGAVIILLVGFYIMPTVQPEMVATQTGFQTDIDEFLVNPDEARAVAAFLNSESQPDDVIVTTPTIGWMLNGHPIDFQMAIALTDHIATPHLPADVNPARLAFNPDYRQARYVVIDNLWRSWGAANVPGLSAFMADVEANWQRAYAVGDFVVYRSPES